MDKTNWIILSTGSRGGQYGVGTFIRQLCNGLLAEMQVDVFVVEFNSGTELQIRKDKGITFFEIPIRERIEEVVSLKKLMKTGNSISRVIGQYINKEQRTIIHMNFLFQFVIARELKNAFKANLIFTQHVFSWTDEKDKDYFNLEGETYKTVDRIVTVTKHGKEHLIEKGADEDKIQVIYNGIDTDPFKIQPNNSIKKKFGLPENEKIVLYSGRIDPIKGLPYLSEAFQKVLKKHANCRLVIAGNGNYETLIELTRSFSANISYLGFIPFDDLVQLYKAAYIGVIPSLEEHCSYVALEMLHSGLPVVASKIGGLKEIFIHKENALLVDMDEDNTNVFGISPNVDHLTEQMIYLLDNENEQNKFRENARNRAVNYFTANQMAVKYIQLIQNIN